MNHQISTINYHLSALKELYIVGPTASGKSSLAIEAALNLHGEVVCADSQTLRKHLDIGTAKPSTSDQEKVVHHMLDVIEPFAEFSVADFQSMARGVVADIMSRGRLPIIVGGSGMYVDSLYYDYTIGEQQSRYDRAELEKLDVQELQNIITNSGWELPSNSQNPRHLIGVIMRGGVSHEDRDEHPSNKLIVGLMPSDDVLKERIAARIEVMFQQGLVDEVHALLDRYGSLPLKMDAIGYPLVEQYIRGQKTLDEVKQEFVRGHWQYARKQKAWFKRNENIEWFDNQHDALEFIKISLNKN